MTDDGKPAPGHAAIIAEIRRLLEKLTAEERLEAFDLWCSQCGEPHPLHGSCQCWNDE